MSSWSGRAQTEPLAALVAVFALGVGLSLYAGALEGSAPETAALGPAIGVYVLLLAVVLTALSTGLSRGLDRATVGYRTGAALLAATLTYLVAFRATGVVAGGL